MAYFGNFEQFEGFEQCNGAGDHGVVQIEQPSVKQENKENNDDELYEMMRLIDAEISKQSYEDTTDADESMESIQASDEDTSTTIERSFILEFNSSLNLIKSNFHSANQNYHQFYQLLEHQKEQERYQEEYQRQSHQNHHNRHHHHQQRYQRSDNIDPLVLSSSVISVPKGSRFFVIKSFNEDDVISSFVHKVWSSTELGNNRLSKAFNSRSSTSERIFLIFSVNGSGKFCGIAEMKSKLNKNPNAQGNKKIWSDNSRWKGIFKIQWLIIKDINNNYLRQLKISINSEIKPVTNSRDTQELPFDIGVKMIDIFKNTDSSTSFLQNMLSQ